MGGVKRGMEIIAVALQPCRLVSAGRVSLKIYARAPASGPLRRSRAREFGAAGCTPQAEEWAATATISRTGTPAVASRIRR